MKKLIILLFLWSTVKAQTYNTVLTNGTASSLFPNHTSYALSTKGAMFGAGFNLQPVALNWTLLGDNTYWDNVAAIYKPINTGYGSAVLLFNGGIWFKTMPSLTAGSTAGTNYTPAYFGGDGWVGLGGNNLNNAPVGAAIVISPSKTIAIHAPPAGTSILPMVVWDAADSTLKQIPQTSAAPTMTLGTGAGTGATKTISGSDFKGSFTITTGTAPLVSQTVATITFTITGNRIPMVMPADGNTPPLGNVSSGGSVYVTGGSSSFALVNTGATALIASRTYSYYYITQ